jgi:hypothetical protein
LENDNYKLYFDRTVLTDIHIHHNRPDIIILNKQQKQAYLLDIAVPNLLLYKNESPFVSLAKTQKRLDRFEYLFFSFVRFNTGVV